jgi:hypothetical protein
MLLDVPWDLSKLLALDLPVGAVAVDALTWQLDLPWWRDGNRWFVVTPNEVRAHPERFAEQWRRTERADLSAPIHFRTTHRGPLILDGLHRLLKAAIEGRSTLPARFVPDPSLPLIWS